MYPEKSKGTIINHLIINALDHQVVELFPGEQDKLFDVTQKGSFDDPKLSDCIDIGTNNYSSVRSVDEDNDLQDQFLRLTKIYLERVEKKPK